MHWRATQMPAAGVKIAFATRVKVGRRSTESRLRENRPYGSEGGDDVSRSLPLSKRFDADRHAGFTGGSAVDTITIATNRSRGGDVGLISTEQRPRTRFRASRISNAGLVGARYRRTRSLRLALYAKLTPTQQVRRTNNAEPSPGYWKIARFRFSVAAIRSSTISSLWISCSRCRARRFPPCCCRTTRRRAPGACP